MPEWSRGSPAKRMCLARRGSNPLGVGVGYWRNWKRASLATTRYWDRNPDTPLVPRRYGLVGHDARLTREKSRVRFALPIFYFLTMANEKKARRRVNALVARAPVVQ